MSAMKELETLLQENHADSTGEDIAYALHYSIQTNMCFNGKKGPFILGSQKRIITLQAMGYAFDKSPAPWGSEYIIKLTPKAKYMHERLQKENYFEFGYISLSLNHKPGSQLEPELEPALAS